VVDGQEHDPVESDDVVISALVQLLADGLVTSVLVGQFADGVMVHVPDHLH
jgi:hypothetical protein